MTKKQTPSTKNSISANNDAGRTSSAQEPVRISFLLIPGFPLMSYAAAVEPLRAANLIAGRNLYEWQNLALADEKSCCSTGFDMACSANFSAFTPTREHTDILFVCAGGNPFYFDDPAVFGWLRTLDRNGIALGGVSGGPVILARAGTMGAHRYTVHWEHGEALCETYPDHNIEQSLYVLDRARLTCAGGVAPIDMMHALIAQHHDSLFAQKVSDWFLHTQIRPPGGAQRSGIAERYGVTHPVLLKSIEYMQTRIANPPQINSIAQFVNISERQLSRIFKENLGQSATGFFRELRLSHGERLLKQTSLSIAEIAFATGFSNSGHFSTNFTKTYGATPLEFRKSRV